MFAGRVEGNSVVPLLKGDGHQGANAVIDLAMGFSEAIAGLDPIPLEEVRLLAPVEPGAIRDFYAFEQHVAAANRIRGREIPAQWYEAPVFYFTNPHTVYGPSESIPVPGHSEAIDYELELACVVGRDCSDVSPEKAADVIAGYTIMNDFSARDLQRNEMIVGLGPSKGKDFATALGPWLVTPDELLGAAEGRPQLEMTASVNGKTLSRGRSEEIHFSFFDLVAHASRDSKLRRGDVLGSGTVGTGCLLELRATDESLDWLNANDEVTLTIEGIGDLRNTIT